jgi:hypothetical protein
MSVHIKRLQEIVPDFTTIIWWRRVIRTKINLDPKVNLEREDTVVIAVDSTGIKVTNRGEWWILDKWNKKRIRKKGFIKVHVATVNIKTKKIVSMEVTNKRKCSWWKDTEGVSSQCV